MAKDYSFKEQLDVGKVGEEAVRVYFQNMSNCITYTDLSDKPKYRDADIDFHAVVEKSSVWESRFYEVKADTRMAQTGNFFIEPEGWLKKTRAETILYLDTNRKLLYELNTHKLKQYVYNSSHNWESRIISTSSFGGFTVTGWLVPYTGVIKMLSPEVIDFNSYM